MSLSSILPKALVKPVQEIKRNSPHPWRIYRMRASNGCNIYSYQGGNVLLYICLSLKFTRLFGTDESQTLPRFLSPITERQCKDKHFFINDVHCELLFFKRTSFFLKSATAATVLFHISMCFFVLRVQRYGKITRNGRNGTTISSISSKTCSFSYGYRCISLLPF